MGEEIITAGAHPAEVRSARVHPGVVAAMVLAWLVLAASALIAIAYMLGWIPRDKPALEASAPKAATQAAQPAVTTQSGVVLLPGETLVAAPEAPAVAATPRAGPGVPQYAKPAPKPLAPRVATAPPPSPPAASPRTVAPPAPKVARAPPQYSRAEIRGIDRSRDICFNCAVVTAIERGDYAWEVAVRFDDGSRETIRYYDRPRLRVGDAVHLEDGRLIPD